MFVVLPVLGLAVLRRRGSLLLRDGCRARDAKCRNHGRRNHRA